MLRKGDTGQRLMALDLIGRRMMTACIPELLKVAGDNDSKVRSSALKKLGELGSSAQLPALLGLLSRTQDRQDLDAIEQALGAVCGRAASPEACVDQLTGQMSSVPVGQKAVLLRVLSAIGGAKALKAVRAAVDDSNAEVHAAVRIELQRAMHA